jgi:hypothetical protein
MGDAKGVSRDMVIALNKLYPEMNLREPGKKE